MIGLAPLIFGHPSNTVSTANQMETISATIAGLLYPLDHPAASFFALAGGVLLACLKNRD